MKQALILGCSHITGKDLSSEPGLTFSTTPAEYELNNNYASLVAQRLGYRATNLAIAGGSNDSMFRLFVQQTMQYDLVIVAWTGRNRTEMNHQGSWYQICPGQNIDSLPENIKNYAKSWFILESIDKSISQYNKIKNILALNSLAYDRNIPVINLDSFWPVTNFHWPNYVYWPVAESFDDWCTEKKYPPTETRHFYASAHCAYANYLLDNIKEY